MKPIKAWYFSDESRTLRHGDGRDIAIGVEHKVTGYPKLREHGLHASERLIDALQYAPGPVVWRVELSGRFVKGGDKMAATRRKYIAGGVNISDTLRKFARKQALSVAHLWDMPDIVRQYLETGDESIRSAAESAAEPAAWSAAESAAESAARSAAWSAAWSAARSAAWSAAESAARSAARSAAWSAAWSAAESAARSAARSAAWSAANDMLEQMAMEGNA